MLILRGIFSAHLEIGGSKTPWGPWGLRTQKEDRHPDLASQTFCVLGPSSENQWTKAEIEDSGLVSKHYLSELETYQTTPLTQFSLSDSILEPPCPNLTWKINNSFAKKSGLHATHAPMPVLGWLCTCRCPLKSRRGARLLGCLMSQNYFKNTPNMNTNTHEHIIYSKRSP